MESTGSLSIAASMGLANLQNEPQRLQSEADKLNTNFDNLVMENYKIFVENLSCSVNLRTEDKKITEVSTELKESLHGLNQQCSAFRDRVHHFVDYHKRNRKTLQHHMQLVELLEVPQLVDACARNGFHDEALELANFVNGLERRHLLASEVRSLDGASRGGSGVVQTIVDDVHGTLVGLRHQLLNMLTENASLPKALQVLATLRKLDAIFIDRQLALEKHENEMLAQLSNKQREMLRQRILQYSETRLQMDFLEARTVWLRKIAHAPRGMRDSPALGKDAFSTIDSGDDLTKLTDSTLLGGSSQLGPYGRSIELLEVNRTAWFSIVTQFKALFGEVNMSGVGGSTSGSSANKQSLVDDDMRPFSATAVLGAWSTHHVHKLMTDLSILLPQIEEGTSLRTVLEQAVFFATRMGEVGCDFSGLLLPLFQNVLVSRIQKDLRTATKHFKDMVSNEKFSTDIDDQMREQVVPLYLSQDKEKDGLGKEFSMSKPVGTKSTMSDEVAAPSALMTFPPLAYLLNAILSSLNFLRECPMSVAEGAVLAELSSVLEDVCTYIHSIGADLQRRGRKYFGASADGGKKNGGESSAEGAAGECIDQLYGDALAKELIPHAIYCLEKIYGSKPAGSSLTPKSASTQNKISKLSDAKDKLSLRGYAHLSRCWAALGELVQDPSSSEKEKDLSKGPRVSTYTSRLSKSSTTPTASSASKVKASADAAVDSAALNSAPQDVPSDKPTTGTASKVTSSTSRYLNTRKSD